MKIRFVKGDLIAMAKRGEFGTIAHGCNCFCTMGSGIAPQMNKLTDGRLLEADKRTKAGDINKLGKFSFVGTYIGEQQLEVYNLYTQYVYGNSFHGVDNPVLVNWDAVYDAIVGMVECTSQPARIGIPLIGCGLAGGRIEDFMNTMERLKKSPYPDVEIVVVEYSKTGR